MRTRLHKLLALTLLLVVGLTATGAFAAGETVPGDRTFYFRGSGCGATEAFELSVKSGTDEYDGCGPIAGAPVSEAFHHIYGPETKSASARDGVPVMLDAARNVAGQVQVESWFDGLADVPGVGQVIVDIAIYGVDTANKSVVLGTLTKEVIVDGKTHTKIPFEIDVPDAAQGVTLKDLTMDVTLHGANYNSSNLGLSGDTKFTLPILLPAPTTP